MSAVHLRHAEAPQRQLAAGQVIVLAHGDPRTQTVPVHMISDEARRLEGVDAATILDHVRGLHSAGDEIGLHDLGLGRTAGVLAAADDDAWDPAVAVQGERGVEA